MGIKSDLHDLPSGAAFPATSTRVPVAEKGLAVPPITLGALTLRVETAAIYCLSILNYELNGVQ